MTSLKDKLRNWSKHPASCCGDKLKPLQDILQHAKAARVTETAAGLAYYAFFSLFPLLLIMVAVGSFFVQRDAVFQHTVELVAQSIPISTQLIERNFSTAMEQRGSIGLLGILTATWSASNAFTILATNISRAWPSSETRNFAKKRLVALAMIGGVGGLLWLSLLSSVLFELLPQFDFLDDQGLWSLIKQVLLQIIRYGVPLLVTWVMFVAMYRWVPNTQVTWKAALWAAACAAVVWEIIKQLFSWYLRSGLARYELVYGSLGTLMAFLFWIYLSANIILYGAHVCAYLDGEREVT